MITVDSIRQLEELHKETGLDICGENGEYHTMVLDGPLFQKHLSIDGELKSVPGNEDWWYLKVVTISAQDKS